jgi:hypothetical protein
MLSQAILLCIGINLNNFHNQENLHTAFTSVNYH